MVLKILGGILVAIAVIVGLFVFFIGFSFDWYDDFYDFRSFFFISGILIILFGSIPGLCLTALGTIKESIVKIEHRNDRIYEDFYRKLSDIAENTKNSKSER